MTEMLPTCLVCSSSASLHPATRELMLCDDHIGVMMNYMRQASVSARVDHAPLDSCPVCREPAPATLILFGLPVHHACMLNAAQTRVTVRVPS